MPNCVPPLNLFPSRQVSDAIPIPGLLDALGPAVQAARTMSPSFNGFTPPSPSSLLSAATSFMPPMLREVVDEGGRLSRAALALEQLGSVAGEVRDSCTLNVVKCGVDMRQSPLFGDYEP